MSVRRLADVAGVVGTALLAAALGLQLAPAQAATPAVAKAFYDAQNAYNRARSDAMAEWRKIEAAS